MLTVFSIPDYFKLLKGCIRQKTFLQDISTSQIINSLYLWFDPKRSTSKLTEHFLFTFSLYILLTIAVSLHVFPLLKSLFVDFAQSYKRAIGEVSVTVCVFVHELVSEPKFCSSKIKLHALHSNSS